MKFGAHIHVSEILKSEPQIKIGNILQISAAEPDVSYRSRYWNIRGGVLADWQVDEINVWLTLTSMLC